MQPSANVSGLLASRLEISSSRNKLGCKRPRKFCDHCCKYLSVKTFKKHKGLYLKDDGSWMKLADCSIPAVRSTGCTHDDSPAMPTTFGLTSSDNGDIHSASPSAEFDTSSESIDELENDDVDYEEEDSEEVWDNSDESDLDVEERVVSNFPVMPNFERHSKELSSAKILVVWLLVFVLKLQTRYYMPDAAIDLLIKFFCMFFAVLGRFSPFVKIIYDNFPKTLYDVKNYVQFDSSFTKYVICPKCTLLYTYDEAKMKVGTTENSKCCTNVLYPTHPYLSGRNPCNALLMKTILVPSGKKILHPFQKYCYKSLHESLQSLLLKPDFHSTCQLWRRNVVEHIGDVFSCKIWKDFQIVDGKKFLALQFAYAVMLNIDWFQPFSHTVFSVGVLYLTVLNLPRHLRFKRENVIIVGIIPGPSEPSHDVNSFLRPFVDEMLQFWNGVKMHVNTASGIVEKTVQCALLCIACDLPAGRKACGFLSHAARLGCSRCLKEFPGSAGKMCYAGFDRENWPPRTSTAHKANVKRIKSCVTKTSRAALESSLGCRYSCLIDLPYFDAPRQLVIDPMHNLFLGTAKYMIQLWIQKGILSNTDFCSIQEFVDNLYLPPDIGRIPYKIGSNFSGFKADQFKTWTNIYSVPALFNILPSDHLECWRHFVLACRRLCQHRLSSVDVTLADSLLIYFCKKVERIYGADTITPNMHMHGHLKDVLLDFGPVQEFWLFSFERYNGLLGKQPTNNRSVEAQLMRRFLADTFANSLSFPDEFADDFANLQIKERLVGSVLDTVTVEHFALPTRSTRGVFDPDELEVLSQLYIKLYPNSETITTNSLYIKYKSVTLNGKHYASSGIKVSSIHISKACIALSVWDPNLYGSPPTLVPNEGDPGANNRPVLIHYFAKVTFSSIDFKVQNSIVFARVSWLYPNPDRKALGKPAELWCSNMYESFGRHSFIPVDNTHILCRCAFGSYNYKNQSLVVVVPIVE